MNKVEEKFIIRNGGCLMIARLTRITVLFGLFIVALLLIVTPSSAAMAEDEITILFTHDLHDNFYPFAVKENNETKFVGGFARLATAIHEARESTEHSILVDAGDYAMGTLFQTIFSTHAPTLRIMGHLEYDAVSFGNHEFDFRADGLAKSLLAAVHSEDTVPTIVAANMVFPVDEDGNMRDEIAALQEAMDTYGVTPYTVVERGEIKIGIFGLVGEDAASNAPMSGVTFDPIVDAAEQVVTELKEKEGVDLIVALSHSGTSDQKKVSEDEVLAENVPDIDVIVSGHTHTFLDEPIIVNDTVIGSTGEYGQNLGTMTLRQNETGRWDLVDYGLRQITDELEPDSEVKKRTKQFKKIVQKEYLDYFDLTFDEVLAYAPFHITDFATMYDRHAEDPLGNLIGDAYIATVSEHDEMNADPITAAVVPVGTIRNSFYKGEITVSDV